MSELSKVNQELSRHAPTLFRMLSPLGLRAVFPKGIPFQAGQAKGTQYNATIGQITDGKGRPLPLPVMANAAKGLDPVTTFLYSPQPGRPAVRKAWRDRQHRLHPASSRCQEMPLPFMTHGLTHGISLLADLFADPDTVVILPEPCWGNYKLLFQLRYGSQIQSWSLFDEQDQLNLAGLAALLAAHADQKVVLLVNFPHNPTGYSPSPSEAEALTALISEHPGDLLVACDDAYQGFVHEDGVVNRSLFYTIVEAADPARCLVVKVDGATKELNFFSSRVGFLSFAIPIEAEGALNSKLNALVRSNVGSPPGPSQALIEVALDSPIELEANISDLIANMTERYHQVRAALPDLEPMGITAAPFNSGFFVVLRLPAGVNAEALRVHLLQHHDVGVIALPSINAIRIAYCSTTDTAQIVSAIGEAVTELVASP